MKCCDYHIQLSDTTAVKGLAIMAMLVHHLFYASTESGTLVQEVGHVGKICVAMFLFISGYGLTIQYGKVLSDNILNRSEQTLKFIYKRYVKFYLSYWIIFIICVPLGVFVFGRGLEIPYGADCSIPKMLVKDFLGLNEMQSYNITWWFNTLIITLYFFFPLIYAYTRNKWTALIILILSYYNPSWFPFVLGIWVATNIEMLNTLLQHIDNRLLCVLSAAFTIALCIWRQVCTSPFISSVYLDGFITVTIVLVVLSLRQWFTYDYKMLPYLGKHSMNMYMMHTFIFAYFFPNFIYGFKYPVLIFIALLLSSLAVSILLEEFKKRIGLYRLQAYLIELGNRKL